MSRHTSSSPAKSRGETGQGSSSAETPPVGAMGEDEIKAIDLQPRSNGQSDLQDAKRAKKPKKPRA